MRSAPIGNRGITSMFSNAVIDLTRAYEALLDAQADFKNAILSEADLPCFLPGFQGDSVEGRHQAIPVMIRNFYLNENEEEQLTGLICASAGTLEAAALMNDAKDCFQQAISIVRELGGSKKTALDKLVDRALHREGRRTEELELALSRLHLHRLDLLRCYAHIRVLPPKLESVSWTWATRHSSIKLIEFEEAETMANALPVASTRNAVLHALSQLKPGEKLAMKKALPNTLRANIVFWEGGIRKRKAINVSGILLSPDLTLPKHILWRDDPGDSPLRLERSDVSIQKIPYIPALNLYRYIDIKA